MKKTLDTTSLVNELRGQSVFFPTNKDNSTPEYSGEPRDHSKTEEPVFQNDTKKSTPVRDVPPVRPVPSVPLERDVRPVPFKKRIMKSRHPFDIYQDQYESLKQLADQERRQGGMGSMSAMVRKALDTFIAAKHRKGK